MTQTKMITVRVTEEQYQEFKRAAAHDRQSLNQWAITQMQIRVTSICFDKVAQQREGQPCV